ncbi:MAG: hypothetical protein WBX01_14415 [Nitrososphaeraceae archaeon]
MKTSGHLHFLIIFLITGALFVPLSGKDIEGQSPQSRIEDEDRSLNASEVVYNAFTSKFLGSRNISLIPHYVTEEHYIEDGFLKGAGNVTNNQTFVNTYLSDGLTSGKGKGTIKTTDGQNISWVSSDLGTLMNGQWFFYGVILFNNTHTESLSILNNSIGLYKSTPQNPRIIWLWK